MKKIIILAFMMFLSACTTLPEKKLTEYIEFEEKKLDKTIGKEDKFVTIITFFDFGSEHCKDMSSLLEGLKADFGSQLKIERHHYPDDAESLPMAEASECAREQGKFLDFYDEYFENHFGYYDQETIDEIALRVGADLNKFHSCLQSNEIKNRIIKDKALGRSIGVTRVPYFLVNERVDIAGVLPQSLFTQLIKKFIKIES